MIKEYNTPVSNLKCKKRLSMKNLDFINIINSKYKSQNYNVELNYKIYLFNHDYNRRSNSKGLL